MNQYTGERIWSSRDAIDHGWLVRFVAHRRALELIGACRKALEVSLAAEACFLTELSGALLKEPRSSTAHAGAISRAGS